MPTLNIQISHEEYKRIKKSLAKRYLLAPRKELENLARLAIIEVCQLEEHGEPRQSFFMPAREE